MLFPGRMRSAHVGHFPFLCSRPHEGLTQSFRSVPFLFSAVTWGVGNSSHKKNNNSNANCTTSKRRVKWDQDNIIVSISTRYANNFDFRWYIPIQCSLLSSYFHCCCLPSQSKRACPTTICALWQIFQLSSENDASPEYFAWINFSMVSIKIQYRIVFCKVSFVSLCLCVFFCDPIFANACKCYKYDYFAMKLVCSFWFSALPANFFVYGCGYQTYLWTVSVLIEF